MVQETLKNIKFSTAIGDAVKNANLVIEAVTENLGLKQKLLREIERSCSPYVFFVPSI